MSESTTKHNNLFQAFEYSPIGTVLVDRTGNILEVNQAFCEFLGYSKDISHLKKNATLANVLKYDVHKSIPEYKRLFNGEITSFETEEELIHRQGHTLSARISGSIVKDKHNQLLTAILQVVEVLTLSDSVRDIPKAQANSSLLESFIDKNLDPILIFNEEEEIVRTNKAFEATFGWKESSILGRSLDEVPWISKGKKEENLMIRDNKVVTGGVVQGLETTGYTKEGTPINVLMTTFPIEDGSNNTGWAVILKDITKSKQAEQLMIDAEKLSAAGQLAAGIAHEIRNPITSIKGFFNLIKSGLTKERYFEIITSELERIEQILSELLMLAKPQGTKFEEKGIIESLNPVITLMIAQANLNDVKIVTDYKVSEDIIIYCEENQLKQVYINIIKNAIEAMQNGGQIKVELESLEQTGEVSIRITDQGCGIPKDKLKHIGEPFYTTKETGTGLGFMITKRIIESHSGKLNVYSEEGKGTTIEIILPTMAKARSII